jgi:hypothetical protein
MKSVRFLENHDEPRSAVVFSPKVHQAASVITFLVPGMHLFHEGQFEGHRIKLPIQLGRRPHEPNEREIWRFYMSLLECRKHPALIDGRWQLLDCRPAWDGNPTWDRFIAFVWEGQSGPQLLVAVNYGPTQGQCYVHLPFRYLSGYRFLLTDLMSAAHYEREGSDLAHRGLFLDMPDWGYHVFEMRRLC